MSNGQDVIGHIEGEPVLGDLLTTDITSGANIQWIRKIRLLVSTAQLTPPPPAADQGQVGQVEGSAPVDTTTPGVLVVEPPLPPEVIDLSQLRIRFHITAMEYEHPNAAVIRIYNLSDTTMAKIKAEFIGVTLEAGYLHGDFGQIFTGTIKQFRQGRESPVDSYFDILAADGDLQYNFGFVGKTFTNTWTATERIQAMADEANLPIGYLPPDLDGVRVPSFARGKVAWGMLRTMLRGEAQTAGCTWSIQGGKLQMIPLDGYLPGEAVQINSFTGMIGIPEQTDEGIKVRTLLNPRLKIGGLVEINQADINQTIAQDPSATPGFPAGIRFDQWTGLQGGGGVQAAAKVSSDGLYRAYVIEYTGDTRGQEWYSDLVCLSVKRDTNKVQAQ